MAAFVTFENPVWLPLMAMRFVVFSFPNCPWGLPGSYKTRDSCGFLLSLNYHFQTTLSFLVYSQPLDLTIRTSYINWKMTKEPTRSCVTVPVS